MTTRGQLVSFARAQSLPRMKPLRAAYAMKSLLERLLERPPEAEVETFFPASPSAAPYRLSLA